MKKIYTSEAVFIGHPDKICDEISDAILDACLSEDKGSRVAVECLIKDELLVIAGEVTTKAKVDYKAVACRILDSLGYDSSRFNVAIEISEQSPDIALGVDKDGAGDQGIMYGYACADNESYMPMPITLARKIAMKMNELRGKYPSILKADGKCQVSVEYNENNKPMHVTTIVVSQQTAPNTDRGELAKVIIDECIKSIIPSWLISNKTTILINPTGLFEKGGSYADSGLTGRKIICDTYGGIGRHGGGAFSGKDVTKVDRLAAYYCRYVAKNIVASGVAKRCEIGVSYAIGIDEPVSLTVDTFGSSRYTDEEIYDAVTKLFNFKPRAMQIELLKREVVFQRLAEFGHVGRDDLNLPWERTNKAYVISSYLKDTYGRRL